LTESIFVKELGIQISDNRYWMVVTPYPFKQAFNSRFKVNSQNG